MQRPPLIGWLGNGRYKEGRGSIGNWEALMELYGGLSGGGGTL